MDGDGEHVRVLEEHPLHPVAVVGVGVDVGDPDAGMLLLEAGDGHACVVVDAEAAGLRAERVVEAAGDAHRVRRVPAHDEPARLKNPSNHAGAGGVHVREDRVVPGTDTVVEQVREQGLPDSRLLNHPHVGQVVDGRQVLVGGGFGGGERVAFQEAERLAELQGQAQAQGVEGVLAAEAVGLQGGVVDDGGLAGHSRGGHRTV